MTVKVLFVINWKEEVAFIVNQGISHFTTNFRIQDYRLILFLIVPMFVLTHLYMTCFSRISLNMDDIFKIVRLANLWNSIFLRILPLLFNNFECTITHQIYALDLIPEINKDECLLDWIAIPSPIVSTALLQPVLVNGNRQRTNVSLLIKLWMVICGPHGRSFSINAKIHWVSAEPTSDLKIN